MTIIAPNTAFVIAKPASAAAQKRLTQAREAVQTLAATKSSTAQRLALPSAAAQELEKSAKQARLDMRGAAKTRAKETIERLKKEIELIKRLWAHDAKQMARELARIGKDLKAAVKDYAKAAKENGADAAALRQDLTSPPPQGAAASVEAPPSAAQPDADGEHATPTDRQTPDSAEAGASTAPLVAPALTAASAYHAQDRHEKVAELKDRIAEAKGDLTFVQEVRGLVKKIRELMQEAKIKAHFDGKNKADKDEAFKAFEESMARVEEALGDLETGVRDDFPELSTGQSISA